MKDPGYKPKNQNHDSALPEEHFIELEDILQDDSKKRLARFGFVGEVYAYKKYVVVSRQKILMLDQAQIGLLESENRLYQNLADKKTQEQKEVNATLLRRGDFPNPDGTFPVLVELQKITAREAIDPIVLPDPARSSPSAQANNFLLCGERDPNSPPSPPLRTSITPGDVFPTDFQVFKETDRSRYTTENTANLVVAVVDTGVKFDLINRLAGQPPSSGEVDNLYKYFDQTNQLHPFKLFTGITTNVLTDAGIGYCGVTDYLDFNTRFPQGQNAGFLENLRPFAPQKVKLSAFDDNRVKPDDYVPNPDIYGEVVVGRHGSFITAIINQKAQDAHVLPVKGFNCGGFATLFDIINCLNYILNQKEAGVPIKLVNMSWLSEMDDDGRDMLRLKIKELRDVGVLVIASASNEKTDMGNRQLYPANFSKDLENVITVTTVKRQGTKYNPNRSFSKEFVSLAVYSDNGTDPDASFKSPCKAPGWLTQTSFATAFVTAKIANHLLANPGLLAGAVTSADRDAILGAISSTKQELKGSIKEGRLMTVVVV